MYYSMICYDREDGSELRKKKRDDHISFLSKYKDRILFAGPLLSEENNPKGSLIVIKGDSKGEIEEISKKDPYFLAGLFKTVEIFGFKKVF